MPPEKKNGSGSTTSQTRLNDQMAANSRAKNNHHRGARHVPGQMSLVATATVHEPMPGRKTADLDPDTNCPKCGYRHSHRSEWPPPQLVTRRAQCGRHAEYAVRAKEAVKATSRSRRVKAVA